MGLYERLLRIELPAITCHQFSACCGEIERGKMTLAQAATALGLSAAEQTELSTLIAKIGPLPESYPLGAFVTLTNVGSTYDAIPAAKGLGFVAVDVTGLTRLEIRIRYNKIGTGTLSWQLWNETDSGELGVFDDTGAASDNKTATIIVTPASPLSGGVKLLRPRVKSTVATDDPVFYGACVFVRRDARLTSFEVHEIVLLAEKQHGDLTSVAALKARFGVV